MKRLISDPHHHLWNPSTNSWINQKHRLKTVPVIKSLENYSYYGIDQFLSESKKYKLDSCVYLQCGYNDNIKEVEAMQSLYDKYGFPNGIIGYANLQSDNIEYILKKQMKYKNFRGIRPTIKYHQIYEQRRSAPNANIMMSPTFHNGLQLMSKYNLILELHLYPSQLKYASIIACSYPKLKMIINHCAYPLNEDIEEYWNKGMELMSKCKNVFVKLSGWCIFDEHFNHDSMKYIIKKIVDLFGVNKCMFASNFPVDKPYGHYDMYWDLYIKILQELGFTETQIDKMIHKNAIKIYKLHTTIKSTL
eukprot:474180_1